MKRPNPGSQSQRISCTFHARDRGATHPVFRLIGAVLVLACLAFAGSPDPLDSGFRSGTGHTAQTRGTHYPFWAGASDVQIPPDAWTQSHLHTTETMWGRIRVRRVPNLGRLVRTAFLRTHDSDAWTAPPVSIASLISQTGPRIAIGRSPPRSHAGWVA